VFYRVLRILVVVCSWRPVSECLPCYLTVVGLARRAPARADALLRKEGGELPSAPVGLHPRAEAQGPAARG